MRLAPLLLLALAACEPEPCAPADCAETCAALDVAVNTPVPLREGDDQSLAAPQVLTKEEAALLADELADLRAGARLAPGTSGVCAGPETSKTCRQVVVSQERPLAEGTWHYVLPYRLPRLADPERWEVELLEACAVTDWADGAPRVWEDRRARTVTLSEREGTVRLLPFTAPSPDGARACAWRAYFRPELGGTETMVEGRFRLAAARPARPTDGDAAPADDAPADDGGTP